MMTHRDSIAEAEGVLTSGSHKLWRAEQASPRHQLTDAFCNPSNDLPCMRPHSRGIVHQEKPGLQEHQVSDGHRGWTMPLHMGTAPPPLHSMDGALL